MERKQFNIRLKKIIIERLKLLAYQDRRTIQDLLDEIIELGIIEYLKGGIYNEEKIYRKSNK